MSIEETLSAMLHTVESNRPQIGLRWGTVGEVRENDFCVFFPGDNGFILVDQQLSGTPTVQRGDRVLVSRLDSGTWVVLGKLSGVGQSSGGDGGGGGGGGGFSLLLPPSNQRVTVSGVTYDYIFNSGSNKRTALAAYGGSQGEMLLTCHTLSGGTTVVAECFLLYGTTWWRWYQGRFSVATGNVEVSS